MFKRDRQPDDICRLTLTHGSTGTKLCLAASLAEDRFGGATMPDILIELEKKDETSFTALIADMHPSVTEVEATRFDGVSIVQLLIALNSVTIPVIGKLMVESIRSKRHVVVKWKGVEIRGLDPDGIIAVLRDIERQEAQEGRKASSKRRRPRS